MVAVLRKKIEKREFQNVKPVKVGFNWQEASFILSLRSGKDQPSQCISI